jgi:predicted PurR-regulated permease PerM
MTAQQTFRNTAVVILTLVTAYALYASIRILIVLLLAIIVASAARPAVLWLHKRGLSEGLAILLVYGLLGLAFFILGVVVLPPAVNQFTGYLENDQNLANRLIAVQQNLQDFILQRTGTYVTLLDPEGIRTTVSEVVRDFKTAVPAIAGEFGGLLGDFVLVVVMGVYWLTSRDQAVNFVLQLFPMGQRAGVGQIVEEIEGSMSAYVRGLVLVCCFVGFANFALLTMIPVIIPGVGPIPNAVTLAFIIGITTALPIIGGYIGAGVAVLLALLSSPIHGLITFGSFVAVQQVENHYLTPRMMSRSVGLNPILIIVFLFIGFAVGGVVGALISVPIAGMITILLRHLVIEPRKEGAAPQHVDGGILLPPGARPKESDPEPKPTVASPGAARPSNLS